MRGNHRGGQKRRASCDIGRTVREEANMAGLQRSIYLSSLIVAVLFITYLMFWR
jgi:hypothetical protein